MFRDVPECSGMFHVPDFIDALHAARFNYIFLKLFDRHATYCYLQVDLKSFLASGAFFFRPRSHRASYDFASNKF